MIRLNPFPILLNNLSNELDDRNLQSLIHVCGDYIPGGQRERIRSGWDVFNILLRQNVIGGSEPEKMANLLLIFKELRPRRRDLVHMIKQHIREHCDQPDFILKLDSSAASPTASFAEIISRNQLHSSINNELRRSSSQCCGLHCCCFTCNCNRCNSCCGLPCCCVILAVLFTFFTIIASLAWYADIPKVSSYLRSNDDLLKTGPYVIGFLGGFALTALCAYIYIRCACVRQRDNRNYAVIPSTENNSSIQSQRVAEPVPTLTSRAHPGPPDSPITDLSSIVSECETVPDGLQQDNFMVAFPKETGQEEELFFTPKERPGEKELEKVFDNK